MMFINIYIFDKYLCILVFYVVFICYNRLENLLEKIIE